MQQDGIVSRRVEFLLLAVLLVYSSHALPEWIMYLFQSRDDAIEKWLGSENLYALWSLLFSTFLVIHNLPKYGVRLGNIRDKWPWLLVLCFLPIVLTLIVYPRLSVKPFSGGAHSIWSISPLAQDLLFAGYFYEKSSQLFPGVISRRVPMQKCIFVTAALFALWHTPGFLAGWGSGFACFQLVYTFAGACLVGIIRQWTGSIVYITLIHMAVNYIAVAF